MQNGCFEWLKTLNKATILNMVRLYGPISRAEIAKIAKIAPPTVTNIVVELIDEGMVIESDLGVSTGGRKPILLEIDSSRFRVLGITVQKHQWEVAIADLNGQIVHHFSKPFSLPSDEKHFLVDLQEVVEEAFQLLDDHKNVLGIGIGLGGRVNPQKGTLMDIQLFPLSSVPIKRYLEEAFQIPVEVENDMRALALAESWYGQGKDIANFISIHVDRKIGAGIVIDHQLYRGEAFASGDIGHMRLDGKRRCRCGKVGCLEALVSGPAIVEQAKEAIEQGADSCLIQIVEGDLDRMTENFIYEAAKEGDLLAKQIIKEAGHHLGIVIDHLLRCLNPSRIILHGSMLQAEETFVQPLLETVRARTSEVDFNPAIFVSDLGPEAIVMGAYTLVLEKIFTPSIVKKHRVINKI